jgi:hypothetical protein
MISCIHAPLPSSKTGKLERKFSNFDGRQLTEWVELVSINNGIEMDRCLDLRYHFTPNLILNYYLRQLNE